MKQKIYSLTFRSKEISLYCVVFMSFNRHLFKGIIFLFVIIYVSSLCYYFPLFESFIFIPSLTVVSNFFQNKSWSRQGLSLRLLAKQFWRQNVCLKVIYCLCKLVISHLKMVDLTHFKKIKRSLLQPKVAWIKS